MRKFDKKPWPWYAVAGMDLLISGAALCAFALFHHVLPRTGNAIQHIVDVDDEPEATMRPAET
ncbi:MAG: hypothetical protein ACOYI3_01560, partial [Christensenellales bacterium]